MTGIAKRKKGIITIPEAQRLLKEKYGLDATLVTIRRRVDELGLADRFGNYRVMPTSALAKLAKALK